MSEPIAQDSRQDEKKQGDKTASGMTDNVIKRQEISQDRRIIAEDPEWNLAPVSKLKDICISVIVKNFESNILIDEANPNLKGMPEKYRNTIIDSISTDLNLKIAAWIISDSSYWKRRTNAKYKLASVVDHGNSWKRCFFELHIRELIENFVPTTDYYAMEEKLNALMAEFAIAAPFVESLTLRQLKPLNIVSQPEDEENALTNTKTEGNKQSPLNHLSLSLIMSRLKNITDLNIYFG
jgi:hypothetical protein